MPYYYDSGGSARRSSSASFSELARFIEVHFDRLDQNPVPYFDRHHWQSHCNRIGISLAAKRDAAIFFLNPDVVVASGGIKSLMSLLDQGKRAIQVLGVRLNQEAVTPVLRKDYLSPDGVRLTVSPRELVRLAMANLHGLSEMHFFDAPDIDLSPSALYWKVNSEGLVARCFHLHPMLVYPRISDAAFSTTIDDDFLRMACPDPADEYVVTNSDVFCACELSSTAREVSQFGARERHR